MPPILALVALLMGCSGGAGQRDPADCDRIANDIRQAAAQRGISPVGICTRPPKDFVDACRAFNECEANDGD